MNRRDTNLGGARAGGGGSLGAGIGGSAAAASTPAPERQLDLGTAPESASRSGSGQVRGGAGQQGGAAVGGRGQAGQGGRGLSSWLAGAENPLAMMRRIQEDLDRAFHAFGVPRLGPSLAPARELEELLARSPGLGQAAQWSPQVEVFERDNSLVVRADLPGVKRDDLEVNIENDVLTIRGQRRQEHREMEGGYRRTERSYGTFFRQIALPEGVDPTQIEASYEDGVLEVTVPSPGDQQAGRRRIEIR